MCRFVSQCLALSILTSIFAAPARADEYADLAALISAPLFPTQVDAKAGYADEAVMFRVEIARRGLREMDTKTLAKIGASDAHSRALAKLEACRRSIDRIREFDSNTPDYSGILDKAVKASPALIRNYQEQKPLAGDKEAVSLLIAKGVSEAIKAGVNQVQLWEEWQTYRSHYADLRETALDLVPLAKQRPCLFGLGITYDQTDDGARSNVLVTELVPAGPCAKSGLRTGDSLVAIDEKPLMTAAGLNRKAIEALEPAAQGTKVKLTVNRSGKLLDFVVERTLPLRDIPDLLSLRLNGSCDGAFETDELSMVNASGTDLTNCTLLVTLVTDNGSTANEQMLQHVHFVRHWPSEKTLVALYHNGTSTRIAKDESFQFIKRVDVEVFSDQFQGANRYSYWNSSDRKADLRRYCESNIEFRGKYLPETDGLVGKGDGLYHGDAAVRVWLDQPEGKPVPRLMPREVHLELRAADNSAAATWPGTEWQGGGVVPFKTFVSPKFNAVGRPDNYEMRLRFHGTDYEHTVRFKSN